MRYVDSNGNVKVASCWLRRLSADRVFPVIGRRNGERFLQPGNDMSLLGIGTCVMQEKLSFRVKAQRNTDLIYSCDAHWSTLRKRAGNYQTLYEQDSNVYKWGLENDIRQYFPNPDGNEFWLFPVSESVTLSSPGYGPLPVDGWYNYNVFPSTGTPKTRSILVLNCHAFAVTVIIHSNTLQTASALDDNLLWLMDSGMFSTSVFVPYYEATESGTAELMRVKLDAAPRSQGTSSATYGEVAVLSRRIGNINEGHGGAVYVGPPIFRFRDFDSMFRDTYDASTTLNVEVVYQFEGA